jgi:hypothetical protein
VEKNSAAPEVQFKGSNSIQATLVLPYVEFVLTEVLKNSLQVRQTLWLQSALSKAPGNCSVHFREAQVLCLARMLQAGEPRRPAILSAYGRSYQSVAVTLTVLLVAVSRLYVELGPLLSAVQ